MNKEARISAFARLGRRLEAINSGQPQTDAERRLEALLDTARIFSPWYTPGNVRHMVSAIAAALTEEKLGRWLAAYDLENVRTPRTVAVIMAGNIPLVGFHDFMSVLLSGHRFLGKLSSDDTRLLPAVADVLKEIEPEFTANIQFAEGRINGIEAVIATGSNNSARYFEHYFGKYPHIIRKNRHGIAVLGGSENSAQLEALGDDIFRYFGLGCRSVTKLFVPRDYKFERFFESIVGRGEELMAHTKYMNNYEYHKSLYLLNSEALLDNHFLLLKEDDRLASPPGVLYYERYDALENVKHRLRIDREHVQCVVSELPELEGVPLGQSQAPALWDYADGVDTMKFLTTLG